MLCADYLKGDLFMDDKKTDRKENKRRFQLWIKQSTLDSASEIYSLDNCASMSEFIEKAVLFYIGYVASGKSKSFLPNVITSTMKSIVSESDTRMSRLLFKLAVEMAMMMNLIAYDHDLDKESIRQLRGQCVGEVKRLNGQFSFEDAAEWQGQT